jgi:hypothetical protein
LGCPVEYMVITKGCRAKLGFLVGYMDITEGSRAMLGSQVRYTNMKKGYRAKLGCPVWCVLSCVFLFAYAYSKCTGNWKATLDTREGGIA